MSVQVEKLEKNTAKLTITVAAEEFDKAMTAAYTKMKKNFSVPGFRKGKVPKQLVEKMYGPEVFYEEAANICLNDSYPAAAKESGLEILTHPAIDITEIGKGKDMVYTAEVGLRPEVELGQYKGIEVEKTPVEVTEEDIEAELKAEQQKNSRTVTVDDRAAQMGDTVNLNYAGTVDGVAFDGGTAEGYDLVLGSGQFIPGFEEQLVGVATGEEKDVAVTFPAEYHAAELAGKEANFHCLINRIEKQEIPELDDEFAQDVSEFDTLEEYKESLKKTIEERKQRNAEMAKTNKAMDKAVANARIELSDLLINEQVDNMFEQTANNMKMQGMDMVQYLRMSGQSVDAVKENMKEDAITQLRTQFVLEEIVKAENIEVTDEKVEEKLADMAKAYGMEVDKLKEVFSDSYMEQFKENMKTELAAEIVGNSAVEIEKAAE